MTIRKIITGIFICCIAIKGNAQTTDTAPVKSHRWTLYAGIGPNYYFNNLVQSSDKVTELNYSIVGRLMWEPEYNLSVGFETGYNQFYSLSGSGPTLGNVSIKNAAVPIQLVVSMKFWKSFYGNFNVGQSILFNNASTSNQGVYDASIISLGDFAASFGYRRTINDRFYFCTEIKAYYSSKLDDKNIALVFLGGYRLW